MKCDFQEERSLRTVETRGISYGEPDRRSLIALTAGRNKREQGRRKMTDPARTYLCIEDPQPIWNQKDPVGENVTNIFIV
jgi:hypothetical protein